MQSLSIWQDFQKYSPHLRKGLTALFQRRLSKQQIKGWRKVWSPHKTQGKLGERQSVLRWSIELKGASEASSPRWLAEAGIQENSTPRLTPEDPIFLQKEKGGALLCCTVTLPSAATLSKKLLEDRQGEFTGNFSSRHIPRLRTKGVISSSIPMARFILVVPGQTELRETLSGHQLHPWSSVH